MYSSSKWHFERVCQIESLQGLVTDGKLIVFIDGLGGGSRCLTVKCGNNSKLCCLLFVHMTVGPVTWLMLLINQTNRNLMLL